eukprot:scaffold9547_cov52-Phaeocystis_antarctica.AAC.2
MSIDIFDILFSASFLSFARRTCVWGIRRYGTARSGKFKLAAIGKYDAVFAATSSSYTAHENNGGYWYFYSPKSMGSVFHIYRYARFETIKQLAQKNQKWYTRPLKYQHHSRSSNQTNSARKHNIQDIQGYPGI